MIVTELVALLGYKLDPAGARQFDESLNKMQGSAATAVENIKNKFAVAGAAISTAFGAALLVGQPIARAGDEMNVAISKIEASIGRSATSAAEAAGLYEKLFQAGTTSGISANESTNAFVRFNLALKDMGRPAEDTITLLQGLQAEGRITGATTAEMSSSVLQLGQALAKGVLSGDELVSLREGMPRMLRSIAEELGLSMAELLEQAEKQLLTTDRIVPALMAAAARARDEAASMPISMSASFDILTNSAVRFMAEIDKTFQISVKVGAAFRDIAASIDAWRPQLATVAAFVESIGGLERIVRLAGIAIAVALGPIAVGFIAPIVAGFASLVVAAAPVIAAVAAITLVIDDLISWAQGAPSIAGELFGDFAPVAASAMAKFEEFRAFIAGVIQYLQPVFNAISVAFADVVRSSEQSGQAFLQTFMTVFNAIGPIFDTLVSQFTTSVNAVRTDFAQLSAIVSTVINAVVATFNSIGPAFDTLVAAFTGAVNAVRAAWAPLGAFFDQLWDQIISRFLAVPRALAAPLDWLKGAVRTAVDAAGRLTGIGQGNRVGATTPETPAQAQRAQQGILSGAPMPSPLQSLLGAPMPDVTGRMAAAAGNGAGNSQSNTITNEVTINAPGADPASVAAGVSSGMGRATSNMTEQLGNVALGLGTANPRIERAAQ